MLVGASASRNAPVRSRAVFARRVANGAIAARTRMYSNGQRLEQSKTSRGGELAWLGPAGEREIIFEKKIINHLFYMCSYTDITHEQIHDDK